MKQLSDKLSALSSAILVIVIFLTIASGTSAQTTFGSGTLQVRVIQGLHFGTFSLNGVSGGTVTVNAEGGRSSTGDITLLAITPLARAATLEINLAKNRNVILTFSPSISLAGKNGRMLQLELGPTNLGTNNVLLAPGHNGNITIPVRIGGTLHVPGATQPGVYSGMFDVTFHQE